MNSRPTGWEALKAAADGPALTGRPSPWHAEIRAAVFGVAGNDGRLWLELARETLPCSRPPAPPNHRFTGNQPPPASTPQAAAPAKTRADVLALIGDGLDPPRSLPAVAAGL